MTVTTTDNIVREKAEPETSSFAISSSLLDTEIDCKIWALGITEKTDSAEVMLEKEYGFRQLEGIQSKVNLEAKDNGQLQPQQRHQQLFDFVHIRYQNSGISDGQRVFRLAFEQTKPGGWIEVLEATPAVTSNSISELSNQRTPQLPRKGGLSSKGRDHPPNTSHWIKQQLLAAGFVDVEEKAARLAGAASSASSRPWFRLWGLGKYVTQLCSGLIGLQWRCGDSLSTLEVDEKARLLSSESPSVFVIARKPTINEH